MDHILVLDDEAYSALKNCIDYLIENEEKDFRENEEIETHVYAQASLVADEIDQQDEAEVVKLSIEVEDEGTDHDADAEDE
jgi:hypothetical protein